MNKHKSTYTLIILLHTLLFFLPCQATQIIDESKDDYPDSFSPHSETLGEIKSEELQKPFLVAAQNGNLKLLEKLKNEGAAKNTTDQYGNTALDLAIQKKVSIEILSWLVHIAEVNINLKNKQNQYSPFLLAAKHGNLAALYMLFSKGVDINSTDQDGNTALHVAAMYASESRVIKWLIDIAQLRREAKNNKSQTAFLCAAETGNLIALKTLREKGANLHATDKNGNNALHLAALFASEGRVIKWLIDTAHISIESKDHNQATPFLRAAEEGNLTVLKTLKEKNVHVNATNQYGSNALHQAAYHSPEGKGIEWLIDTAKINIESRERNKRTPFLCAAVNGNLSVLKILKTNGANLSATDQDGDNALHLAAYFSPEGRGIEWLIGTAKIDIESRGLYKKTPFLCAAEKGNLSALKILHAMNAKVNAIDQDGCDALHQAAYHSPEGKGIEWLIDVALLPIESKDKFKKTPFICAAEKGNLTALKVLKAKGAKVDATSQDGSNALHQAACHSPEGKGIEWLIDTAKINIESRKRNKKTPFLCAAVNGNLSGLKILKTNGANLSARDQDGDNALHLAAYFSPEGRGIEWLIGTAKIDIESRGLGKKTPFLCAAEKGNLPALKMLKAKGSNLYAIDKNGNNALALAKKKSSDQATIHWLEDEYAPKKKKESWCSWFLSFFRK